MNVSQSSFLKYCKDNLSEDTCIFLADFVENDKFIVQESAQAFYFNNIKVTLHYFVIYYKSNEAEDIQVASFCVLSDCLNHVISAVNLFQKKLLNIVKSEFSSIKNVLYFTDGAPSQYKNR